MFGKLSLATMERMEPEELNQAREPRAEAGAAVPLRRGPSLPETQRMKGREALTQVIVIQQGQVTGAARGGLRRKRSCVA